MRFNVRVRVLRRLPGHLCYGLRKSWATWRNMWTLAHKLDTRDGS